MAQRGITRDEVVEAINNPTSTGHPTQAGRTRVRKAFAATGKVIDVVYDELPVTGTWSLDDDGTWCAGTDTGSPGSGTPPCG